MEKQEFKVLGYCSFQTKVKMSGTLKKIPNKLGLDKGTEVTVIVTKNPEK